MAQYRYGRPGGAIAESPWVNLSRAFNEAVQSNR